MLLAYRKTKPLSTHIKYLNISSFQCVTLHFNQNLPTLTRVEPQNLFATRAPCLCTHVDMIAKGKDHKKYEFGNKVSIVSGKTNNIIVQIVGVVSHKHNIHDSKTLIEALDHANSNRTPTAIEQNRSNKRSATEAIAVLDKWAIRTSSTE